MADTKLTNGIDLRRLILDATRHLLVQEGYANLSMRKIASAIGYSATALYLHFDSKDSLFDTLVEEGMDRLYETLTDAAGLHSEPIGQLEAICSGYIDFGLANPEYYEVMFVTRPTVPYRFPSDKYRRARRNLDVIADTLERGRLDGSINVDDVTVGAVSVWTALHGVVSLSIAQRIDRRIDADRLVDTSIRQIVNGFRKPITA